jgi:hypothetical protein
MPQRQGDVGRRSNLIVKVQTMMGDGYYFPGFTNNYLKMVFFEPGHKAKFYGT